MFIVLKLSKLCNLRCTYCYEFDELGSRDRMSLDDLERFFAWLASHQPARGWPKITFVLHGGEPLLLPLEYLEGLVERQRRHLDPAGIKYETSLQTNLTRLDDRILDTLERCAISLGVSLDVFGEQRVSLSGLDSQGRVLNNLQKLFDAGVTTRLGVGVIAVLHRGNVDRIISMYEFCAELGLTCRILPVFALAEPPARMSALTLEHGQVVAAFQRLAVHWLTEGMAVDVFPLVNYLDAAVHGALGRAARTYDPAVEDWAYIVNTNGDIYSNGDAYSPIGWMGNIFAQPLLDIVHSPAHEASRVPRLARAEVCAVCRFGSVCSRVPLVEAVPSERAFSGDGALQCPIALPMIDFFAEQLRVNPAAADLIRAARVAGPRAVPAAAATPA